LHPEHLVWLDGHVLSLVPAQAGRYGRHHLLLFRLQGDGLHLLDVVHDGGDVLGDAVGAVDDIIMDNADITIFRGNHGSDFTGGRFRGIKAEKSIWERSTFDGADFRISHLTAARFCEARLRNANFDRCELRDASFEDSLMSASQLTNANLFKVAFARADLSRAKMDGSNLYGAGFWDTILLHASWRDANIKKTRMSR